MQNGLTVKQDISLSWEKSFWSGFFIYVRVRNCEVCIKSIVRLWDICRAGTKQTEDFEANNFELKRKLPKGYVHMLPHYVTNWMWRNEFF